MTNYVLTATRPDPEQSPEIKQNPYHRWHIAAYIPVLLAAICAGLTSAQLSNDQLDERAWLVFATAGAFVVFTFLDITIQDKLLGGIQRRALYRFTDSYMPLLLLFLSGFISALIDGWADETQTGQIIIIGITVVLLAGLLVTIREMGSLGRVLKPKTLNDMDDDVRKVVVNRLPQLLG